MDEASRKDLEAIEEMHRRDVAATKRDDFAALKSLMDPECVVMPPEGEPEAGQAYLDRLRASAAGSGSRAEVLELVQEWDEVRLLDDYAYEQGVVRYAVRGPEGEIVREAQRMIRILRRQRDGTWRVFRAMWHAPRPASEVVEG